MSPHFILISSPTSLKTPNSSAILQALQLAMLAIRSCKTSPPHSKRPTNFRAAAVSSFRRAAGNKQSAAPPLFPAAKNGKKKCGKLVVRGCGGEEKSGERRSFLSLEEAGLVEISGLSTHERFLCRLTISSLNLLRVISEQEGLPIEQLNAGRVCDWFLKDKLKREQNLDSAVLQWDDSGFQI